MSHPDIARFNALPQDTKDKILEKYRHWNVEHVEWWESVYEQFTEYMKEIGVCVDRIYFSGFWSQGDGACFSGEVENFKLFLPTLYKDEELAKMIEACEAADDWRWHFKHESNYYYHSNTMSFELEVFFNNPYYGEGGLREAAQGALNQEYEKLMDQLADDGKATLKAHANTLYKHLEEEYNYLTSDECILEALIANEMLGEAIDETDPDEGQDESDGNEGEQALGHGGYGIHLDQSTGTGAWQIQGGQTCAGDQRSLAPCS